MYSFGYPSNLDSDLYLKSCERCTQASKYKRNSYVGQGLSCRIGHGCSGGPWLQNVNEATKIGYVTSVKSFNVSNIPDVINGPYFDANVNSMYDQCLSMVYCTQYLLYS